MSTPEGSQDVEWCREPCLAIESALTSPDDAGYRADAWDGLSDIRLQLKYGATVERAFGKMYDFLMLTMAAMKEIEDDPNVPAKHALKAKALRWDFEGVLKRP